jgi:hypothetical protein
MADNTIGWGQAHINNTISFGGDVSCGGGGFDADYQAVLDYATTQGYSLPSAGQQTLQNTLVTDLKAAGVWSKLDAFSVFATDGDADFALIDWVRLTTQTATNSPSFTANQGYAGDGVSAYISSNYTQSTDAVNWVSPNGSWGIYVRTASLTNSHCYAGTDADNRMRRGTAKSISGSVPASVSLDANNTFAHININSSTTDLYYNGVSQGSSVSTPFSPKGIIFDYLREGASGFAADAQLSIGFIGGDLSAEASDFNTAIQTYITSL